MRPSLNALSLLLALHSVASFTNNPLPRRQCAIAKVPINEKIPDRETQLSSRNRGGGDDFDDLRSSSAMPSTSFGAEAVPEGQRPANEYLDLIKQPLFGWAAQDKGTNGLLIRLAIVYGAVFAVVGYPIAGATYTQDGFLLQKIAAANLGSMSIVLAVLVRLYSGWGYVGTRLKSKIVEYEETGWYDGSFEKKSEKEKTRDMFLYRSDVEPVENRLKLLSAITAALWLASVIGVNTAASMKPMFDEYDAKMLQNLSYNEKLADVAAQQSGGRPTYCDSRYYRAIANGGQGCR